MADTSAWMLGLGGSDHDFSAVIARGRDILCGVEQERLTRSKHGLTPWYASPLDASIRYCIEAAGCPPDAVDLVVASDTIPARVRGGVLPAPLKLFPHHLCHAASAYMMLPPDTHAGVFVYDGYGSITSSTGSNILTHARETCSFYRFGPEGVDRLGGTSGDACSEEDDFPTAVTNSVGMFYELITGMLGYDVMDSGKTMGLASHGSPVHQDALERFIRYGDGMDSLFACDLLDRDLVDVIEAILNQGRGGFQVRADLAASAQAVVTRVLGNAVRFLEASDIDALCVSGGCALNSVANGIVAETAKRGLPLHVPPHCGDSGLGLGALWLEHHGRSNTVPSFTIQGCASSWRMARPGRIYTEAERRSAVQRFYPRLALDSSVSSPIDVAQRLAEGAVIGVLNGPSEIGPRALGGRSILADPRTASMRERINRQLKLREPYRPLAPVVLASNYSKYFMDERKMDAFMLKVTRTTELCARHAPAVVHVDGTARAQVVTHDGDPFLAAVLRGFEEVTGVGILINTSFNRRGEPIVETPEDAIDAFLGMKLDGLYLDGSFYVEADTESRSSASTP